MIPTISTQTTILFLSTIGFNFCQFCDGHADIRTVGKRDLWSQLWSTLNSGQGTVVTDNNIVNVGPSSNGKDLGILMGKQRGILQGTGFDTGFTDATNVNAGLGNPGISKSFGLNAFGIPLFNYGLGGNLDLQKGKLFAGTDIGAGKLIPSVFQQGTSIDFGGVVSGLNQMFRGAADTASNSQILKSTA